MNLHSGPAIVAACRKLKPDIVVLQLGHYELPVPLRKILRLRGSGKKIHTQCAGDDDTPHADLRYRPTLSIMFAELRRIVAAGIIIVLGRKRRMFNPAAIADSLDSIISSLKELPLRGIVLVGPFSAQDCVSRFFRRKAEPIFEAAAKRHGCTFVSSFSCLEAYPKGKAFRENFADRWHLSVLGHQRVGVLLGEALKRMMEESTASEVEPVKSAPIKEAGRAPRPGWVGPPPVDSPHNRFMPPESAHRGVDGLTRILNLPGREWELKGSRVGPWDGERSEKAASVLYLFLRFFLGLLKSDFRNPTDYAKWAHDSRRFSLKSG